MRSFPEAGIPPFILQKLRPGYVGETLGSHTRGPLAASSGPPARLPRCLTLQPCGQLLWPPSACEIST